MYKLFDYQQEIREKMDEFFRENGQRLLIQAPTGTGKSIIMCDWIESLRNQGKPVYFVTHSKNLLRQFSEHLDSLGIQHGVVSAGYPTTRDKIQVISAQSLMSRLHKLDEPYALLFEEAHHSTNATFTKILDEWSSCKLVGMTATPQRTDGASLGDVYEKMIVSRPVRWFIDNGYLSDYSYFVPHELDTEGIRKVMGDFDRKALEEKLRKTTWRIGSIVENYQKYADGRTAIAFGTSIADSEGIAERFKAYGYDMKPLHSQMEEDLYDVIHDCKIGKRKLISCCDIIGEGTDIKGLEAMLDGRPTQSLVIQMQHWGRVLRAKYADGYDLSTKEGRLEAIAMGGKPKAVILDFSSNYTRHGLPDDERTWSLEGNGKSVEKSAPSLKVCPRCHRPISKSSEECPFCSYKIEVSSRQRTPIKEINGSLVTVSSFPVSDNSVKKSVHKRESVENSIFHRSLINLISNRTLKNIVRTARKIAKGFV